MNQKNDHHTHALYPLQGPQGSRSVCLGTFSLAGPWSDSMGETTTAHKTLSREQRAAEMDGLKGCVSFKGLALPASLWEATGGGLPRLPWRSLLCVCQDMPGHLQEGHLCSHLNLQKDPIQGIMKNGISTKWRENTLFL